MVDSNLTSGTISAGRSDNLIELEQKHLPVISAPEQVKRNEFLEVTVEVGKLKEHPNE